MLLSSRTIKMKREGCDKNGYGGEQFEEGGLIVQLRYQSGALRCALNDRHYRHDRAYCNENDGQNN